MLCPSTYYLAALESYTTNPGNAYHVVFAVGLASSVSPEPGHVSWSGSSRGRSLLNIWNGGDEWAVSTVDRITGRNDAGGDEAMDRDGVDGSPNYAGAEVVWEGYGGGNEVVVNVTVSVRHGYRVAECDFVANELGLAS